MYSDKLKKITSDVIDIGGDGTISVISSMLGETLLGQFAPGVMSTMLAYKQKRQEKNLKEFLIKIKEKEGIIDTRLSRLEEETKSEFKNKYIGMITDYAIEEKQNAKIEFIVNGLVKLTGHEEIQEDFVLTYYDILNELRMADIGILKYYFDFFDRRNYLEVINEIGIDYEQYEAIREKLNRMGLLITKRDNEEDNLYKNLESIQKFIEDLSRGKKLKTLSFKKLTKNDGYKISKLGRSFIEFFVKEENDIV